MGAAVEQPRLGATSWRGTRHIAVRPPVLQGARQGAQARLELTRQELAGPVHASAALNRPAGRDPTLTLIAALGDGRAAGRAQVRTLVQRELAAALGDWDLLLSPAAPTTAFRVGEARAARTPRRARG
jgi:Asp-tRNA(Asn)/Glu-tRNA(Gln) amidotransferase A subunit family amidase